METIDTISGAYKATFPKSCIRISTGCLGGTDLYVKGYIQNNTEWLYNISHNDPLTYMAIYNPVTNVYKEESLYLQVKTTNPHMAYGSVKLRKVSIKNVTPAKLAARFEKIKAFIKTNIPDMEQDVTDKV